MSAESPKPLTKTALLLVFVVVFIDLLGFGIVLPLLPIFGDTYVAGVLPQDTPKAVHGLILGLLMSTFSMMQFLFAPAWGKLSDRVGRKPILLLGLFGSVVFYGLFGYASSLPAGSSSGMALLLLFVSRLGAGIAGATIATAQAVIADCTPKESRSRGMALIGAAFGIGFTFGPLIGFGALTYFPDNAGATGYIAATLSLVALMVGIFKLPETRVPGGHQAARKLFDIGTFREVLASKNLGPVILVFFLATFGFGSFESTLAMMNQNLLKFEKNWNFLVFAYVGFTFAIGNGFYRPLAKRVSEVAFMTLGILLMGSGVASLAGVTWLSEQGWSPSALMPLMLSTLTVCVVGFSFLTPSAQALVSRRADPDRQGEILGVNQSCSSLARILGPVVGLTLYKVSPMLPFLVGGFLVLAMLPMMPRIARGTDAR